MWIRVQVRTGLKTKKLAVLYTISVVLHTVHMYILHVCMYFTPKHNFRGSTERKWTIVTWWLPVSYTVGGSA